MSNCAGHVQRAWYESDINHNSIYTIDKIHLISQNTNEKFEIKVSIVRFFELSITVKILNNDLNFQ